MSMVQVEMENSDACSVALAFAVAALQSKEQVAGVMEEMTPAATTMMGTVATPMTARQQSEADYRDENIDLSILKPKKGRVHSDAEETGDENDPEEKLARNRERNREHARKTRLRKKAQLEALQSKAKGLEAERQVLKQQIEECSIASILLGFSMGIETEQVAAPSDLVVQSGLLSAADDKPSRTFALLTGGGRKRFILNGHDDAKAQPLKLNIDGQLALIGGGKSHVNWKTGSYVDEDGNQSRLTMDQLEHLRRERNRMHAKMTRDRKKCFIATIEKSIEELEAEIDRMKSIIAEVSHTKHYQMVTPATSPELQPVLSPSLDVDDLSVFATADKQGQERPAKRIRHGFSLSD